MYNKGPLDQQVREDRTRQDYTTRRGFLSAALYGTISALVLPSSLYANNGNPQSGRGNDNGNNEEKVTPRRVRKNPNKTPPQPPDYGTGSGQVLYSNGNPQPGSGNDNGNKGEERETPRRRRKKPNDTPPEPPPEYENLEQALKGRTYISRAEWNRLVAQQQRLVAQQAQQPKYNSRLDSFKRWFANLLR